MKSDITSTCHHSAQNVFSSSLLSKYLNIKIYRTIILPVSSYGCETWHWGRNVGWGCLIGFWGVSGSVNGMR